MHLRETELKPVSEQRGAKYNICNWWCLSTTSDLTKQVKPIALLSPVIGGLHGCKTARRLKEGRKEGVCVCAMHAYICMVCVCMQC